MDEYKIAPNLDNISLLAKFQKCLANLLGSPATSNCNTPTKKVSEFLDKHLKSEKTTK